MTRLESSDEELGKILYFRVDFAPDHRPVGDSPSNPTGRLIKLFAQLRSAPFVTYHNAQIEFLEALHEASQRNLLHWRIVEDDDRDVFVATFDDQQLEVELLYTAAESDRGAERHLLRLTGLKTSITCAIGTRAYDIVVGMLSHHIFGWAEGRAGGIKSLARATQKIRTLLDS